MGIFLRPIKVKICGITNIEDAIVAADAGADFLGFILYPPSKRSVDKETVKAITAELRRRTDCPVLVGVFVNETAEYVLDTLNKCRLDVAQLSGEESVEMLTELGNRGYKGIRPKDVMEATDLASTYIVDPEMPLLVDAYHPTLYGGTGEKADWETAQLLAFDVPCFMLAGGLKPDNVIEALNVVRPWAVDVASGVEQEPGQKDHAKVRAFIENVASVLEH